MTTLRDESFPVPVDLGHGAPVVVLSGYALRPRTYHATAVEIAKAARCLVPDLYALRGAWSYPRVLAAFVRTLDRLELDRVTLVGHSFSGALELGFAAAHPDRVEELVFADTLAVSREWALAREALSHPTHLLRMATPSATFDFVSSWSRRPRELAGAAWWGFRDSREPDIATIAREGLLAHVLWANRDSLLPRDDGREFARQLGASFTVVRTSGVVDHDWMYRHPKLFMAELRELSLRAFAPVTQ